MLGARQRRTSRSDNVFDDLIHSDSRIGAREQKWPVSAHQSRIAFHNAQIRADRRSKIDLVDHQQIGLRDARAAFARDFIAAGDINNVNRKISQLAAEMSGKVVPAGFDQQQIGRKLLG